MQDKRIIIHMGGYGSGKTELSIHEAVRLADAGRKTMLVDLDIVNPYFRSGEHEAYLHAHGIRTVLPVFANTAVDVPSLPAEVQTALDDASYSVVFDVGGDPVGAAALGRYHQGLEKCSWVRCVVNTMRPFTQDADAICRLAELMMARSRLKVDALVNNTHLCEYTTPEMVKQGYEILCEAARRLGVEVEFTMAEEIRAEQMQGVGKVKAIRRFNRPAFMEDGF